MNLRLSKKSYNISITNQNQLKSIITLHNNTNFNLNRLAIIFQELDLHSIQEIWAVKGQARKSNLLQFLPYIEKWGILKLYLWSNKIPEMISYITKPDFYRLKELHIGWNLIESLEGIERVKFPKLTDLVFRDNHIRSISPLRKCYFPDLKDLCGRGNLISEIGSTSKWNAQLIDNFNLNHNLLTGSACFVKMQTNKLQILRFQNKNVVKQPNRPVVVQVKLRWLKMSVVEGG